AQHQCAEEEDRKHDRSDAPSGEPTLEAAAINHAYSVENHDSSLKQTRFNGATASGRDRADYSSASSAFASPLAARFRFGFAVARPLRLRGYSPPPSAFCLVQAGSKDVAGGAAGIGRAVLRHGLLLLGDFERLDRHGDLARLGINLGHHRVELLADAKAIGP